MAHDVARDCRFYLDGFDLSGDTNSVDLGVTTTAVDDTCFGQSVHLGLPGLRGWSCGAAGLLTMADDGSEEQLNAKWNRTSSVVTMSPTGTHGDRAYISTVGQSEYQSGQKIGDALKWTWGGAARDILVPATIIHTKASRAATGNGTATQLGAVASGKSLYAALHVFVASGTTLVVKIQSDDNSGFASATDRITFATATTSVTAELKSVAGSITDDWWRIVYTISGGPYSLAVAAGIL
jgi:hypothetical protein